MIRQALLAVACAYCAIAAPVAAESTKETFAQSGKELPPYLQCVPYARQTSGVQIYGDAHTWWGQAAGKFRRNNTPQAGAVMAFQPYRNMRLGHVATVAKVIDSRTVLLDHSNWSPIDGRRGQIERNVRAIDVSPNNDWSSVRVWYAPLQTIGKTRWPVHGFIHGGKAGKGMAPSNWAAAKPVSPNPSQKFMSAFGGTAEARNVAPSMRVAPVHKAKASRMAQAPAKAISSPIRVAAKDPFAAVLAKYD